MWIGRKKLKSRKSCINYWPHGGNIEAGTTELTKLIAKDNHYDYFSFTVLRKNMLKICMSLQVIIMILHY